MASNTSSVKSEGVHIVGSVRLPTEEEDEEEDLLVNLPTPNDIFQALCRALPQRLRRMPDGETGARRYFTIWQSHVFTPSPWIMPERTPQGQTNNFAPDDGNPEVKLNPTRYDEEAMQSYEAFVKLREDGIIPPSVRFQVCLPSPANVLLAHVRPEYQAEVEPMYEKLLIQAVRNIQRQIPAKDLAIQWDMAAEFGMLEGVGGLFTPWFECTVACMTERITRLAASVDEDVQLGLHLCYGDLNHEHFMQPKDTSLLVEFATTLSQEISHPIHWIHMPVPADRKDDPYFKPLKNLELHEETALYLGLVHAHDPEGTAERIAVAKRAVSEFGVATECGWGRTPVEDISSILETLRAVSTSISNL